MSTFGTRVKQLRKSMKMTMNELGVKIGAAKSTIAGYENGFREPPIEKINLLAFHLNTSVDYLFGLSEHNITEAAKNTSMDVNPLNAKTFLDAKNLHWDGIPLDEADLELIRDLLEKSVQSKPKHVKKQLTSE
jgi:transcriptional regulator with XRE-family HTH domain